MNGFLKLPIQLQAVLIVVVGAILLVLAPVLIVILALVVAYSLVLGVLWFIKQCNNPDDEP